MSRIFLETGSLKMLIREPITREGLTAAYEYLIATLELPVEWMQPPEFAIRSYTHFRDPNPPEPILLNSFFLADLSLAKVLFANDETPHNLRRYLGVERPTQTQDLLLDDETLEKAVSPQNTPLARWPGPGRNPLVLLQQAAINVAFSETTSNGLIGINGPPGTEKPHYSATWLPVLLLNGHRLWSGLKIPKVPSCQLTKS